MAEVGTQIYCFRRTADVCSLVAIPAIYRDDDGFRCKKCQAVIAIPENEEFYDSDYAEENEESYGDSTYSEQAASPPRRKSRGTRKTKSFPEGHPGNDADWLNWLRFVGSSVAGILGIFGVVWFIWIVFNDLASHNWPETSMVVTNIVRERETGRVQHFCVYLDYAFASLRIPQRSVLERSSRRT